LRSRVYKARVQTGRQGMPRRFPTLDAQGFFAPERLTQQEDGCTGVIVALKGLIRSSEMPKMKTKSSAKKRFKITATGKVKSAAAGKRHGMIKRSNKFIRDARGTMVLSEPDAKIVKKFLPNGL
jgi:large subunit ribosomal protein L35